MCDKYITQLVTVSAGAAVPLFSLSVSSPKIYECPFLHFSSSETVPLRIHGCMENMTMKQHPCMTLHFCSENPHIGPFQESKTEVVDTPNERGRHHTWTLGPATLRKTVPRLFPQAFSWCVNTGLCVSASVFVC